MSNAIMHTNENDAVGDQVITIPITQQSSTTSVDENIVDLDADDTSSSVNEEELLVQFANAPSDKSTLMECKTTSF